MQRVAGGKAVAIERRHRALDADQADERSLAHQPVLEEFVEDETEGPGAEHLCRHAQALLPLREAEKQRHRRHQRVPDHTVAETADGAKEASQHATTAGRVGKDAQPLLCPVDAYEDRHGVTPSRGAIVSRGDTVSRADIVAADTLACCRPSGISSSSNTCS